MTRGLHSARCATDAGRSSPTGAEITLVLRAAGIHHLDLVVSSIERSLPFYRELLGPLGWHGHSEVVGERGETIHYLTGPGTALGLREALTPTEGAFDRYRIGMHHVAFEVGSRASVDERAEWLRAHDAEIESGPEPYGYQLGYYAVFFYDPDGLKLELVHVPAHAA